MSNMSYCRFQNTLEDAEVCQDHLWDKDLGEKEEKARNKFIALCHEIADEFPKED